jgi:SnoaL-like protein
METEVIAGKLIELCRKGQFLQAQYELYDTNIVSIDPDGTRTIGSASMYAKEQRFLNNLERIYSISFTDPQIAGNFFTTVLRMEVETQKTGFFDFSEVCVYQVAGDKIVFEQFFRDRTA